MKDQALRTPRYQCLYEILRRQITQGDFKPGDLMPSENDLYTQYKLTRPTIRQALSLLVQDAYIFKHQGKGSVVKPLPLGLGVMSIVGRLVDTATVDADNQTEQLISTRILVKPTLSDFPADSLSIPAESELTNRFYYIERLRSVNGEPVFFEKLILSSQHLPGLSDMNFESRSIFEILRTVYNIVVQGGEQKLLATTATENLAQLLAVPPASPVLRLDKRVDTNNNDFSYYSSLYARTDHFLLHGRF